jgi:branched-subunit amino acid transport protein
MERDYLPLIVAAALITYATRVAGLSLGDRRLPPAIGRFLSYVPIAAFAALAVPGFGGGDDELLSRLAAAGAAAAVVLLTRRLWACLIVGMTVFWLTKSVT